MTTAQQKFDYENTVRVLRSLKPREDESSWHMRSWRATVLDISTRFAARDRQFSEERFLAACEGPKQ